MHTCRLARRLIWRSHAAAHRPLLPAVATGTVEERSIVEPVRRVLKQKVRSRQLLQRPQTGPIGHGSKRRASTAGNWVVEWVTVLERAGNAG